MKLLFAAALILYAVGVRCQDFDCFTSTETIAAILNLTPTCMDENVDLISDSEGSLIAVCALPPSSACRSGLSTTFSRCGQPIDDNFCSLLPTSGSSTNVPATTDPNTECFMREETLNAFAQLLITCQAENIDLATVLTTTPEAQCTLPEGNCRSGINTVYTLCNASLELLCAIINLPTPSPSQAACVNNSQTTRAADIERDCGGSETPFDIDMLRAQCAAGSPCRTLLDEIFLEACGYDALSPICDNLPTQTPATPVSITPVSITPSITPATITSAFITTATMTSFPETDCLFQESTLVALRQLEQTCQNELNTDSDMGDELFRQICSLDQGNTCRSGITRIFGECGIPFDAVCVFESLPTPSPAQQQCIDNAEQDRAADIMRECGSTEISSFNEARSLCAKEGCRSLFQSLYFEGCGYDAVNTVCDSLTTDGSVKLYAVPIVVLITALMSVLF